MGFLSGPSAPKAPKPPPVPTQTRRQAERSAISRQTEINNNPFFRLISQGFPGQPGSDLIGQVDARPDSAFLPPVEQRDFQALDSQIRGGSDSSSQPVTNRNRDMMRSLLELLGEDINSPTIL